MKRHVAAGLAVFWVVISFTLCLPLRATVAHATNLDTIAQVLLDISVADDSLFGASAGISYSDGHSWTGSAGWRGPTKRRALLPTDQFRLGSQTKTYTGTVILQMIDQGAFSLNDTLQTLLPNVPVPNAVHITVRNLLNMTAGIPDYLRAPSRINVHKTILDEWNNLDSLNGPYGYAIYTPEQLVAQSNLLPSTPFGKMAYSNTNFAILGLIAERASCKLAAGCQSIAELIDKLIIQPLGLKATEFPTTDQFSADAHSDGVFPYGDALIDFTHVDPSVPWAAGAMISSPADELIWIRALATNKGGLLSPQLFRQRITEMVPGSIGHIEASYGLAIYAVSGTDSGTTLLGHSGAISGYTSGLFYDPDTDIAYVTNLNTYPAAAPTRFPFYGQTATKSVMNFTAVFITIAMQRNITMASRQEGNCGNAALSKISANTNATCSGDNFRTAPIVVDGGELTVEPSNKVNNVGGRKALHPSVVPSLAFFGNDMAGITVMDGGNLEVEAGAAIEIYGRDAMAIYLSDGATAHVAGQITAYGKGSIAIKGTDGNQSLVIPAGTRIIGDIDLGAGNDRVRIDGSVSGVVRTTPQMSVEGSGNFVTTPH